MTNSQAHSHSMGQEDGEIWTGQALLQPISFKSDRLLAVLDRDVTPFDVSQAAEPLKEGFDIFVRAGCERQESDLPDLAWLLRENTERHCKRTRAKRNNQFATCIQFAPPESARLLCPITKWTTD